MLTGSNTYPKSLSWPGLTLCTEPVPWLRVAMSNRRVPPPAALMRPEAPTSFARSGLINPVQKSPKSYRAAFPSHPLHGVQPRASSCPFE